LTAASSLLDVVKSVFPEQEAPSPVAPSLPPLQGPSPAEALAKLQAIDLEIKRRHNRVVAKDCSASLKRFILEFWPVIEPDIDFQDNWHIDIMCEELERLDAQVVGPADPPMGLIENVPPGTMKTLIASTLFPAWVWTKRAGRKFLLASYAAPLSTQSAEGVRKVVDSERYQELWPETQIEQGRDARTLFATTAGGWVMSTSVGGKGTGLHPDYIVIDDPLTEEQSRSDVERKAVNTWFDRTISSRGAGRGAKIIIVMQRLHEDDLSGHLLAKDPGSYHHVKLPMRFEPFRAKTEKDEGNTPDPRDPRTVAGELMWPSLFGEAKVRKLELRLGPYGTAGQLQQRPAPEGGGLFKREWFKFVDVAPKNARRVRGWDTGATQDGGDFTAGVRLSEPAGPTDPKTGKNVGSGIFYIEDAVHAQLGPDGVDKLMLGTAHHDGVSVSQREQREGGSAGKTVTGARLKAMAGIDYAEVIVSKDKVTLSKPFRAQCEGGNVYIVRDQGRGGKDGKGWNEDFIRELCNFPTGNHDDYLDAVTTAFNAVLLEPVPQEEWFC
jgi:predicted phage terminase large subunit-like protein